MEHAQSLYEAGAVTLAVFLALGAVDGLYLHLWRYRLHARPASRGEHRLHTISAVLFAVTLPAVLLWETGGWLLWAGVGLIAVDLGVSLFDMTSERDSRADFGGLSTGEYVLHMLIMSARGASLALALGARPAAAWAFDAPSVLGPMPPLAATIAWQAFPGAIVMSALHVWLCTESGVRTFEALRARTEAAVAAWRGVPAACCPPEA
jgi:hypothetical protein